MENSAKTKSNNDRDNSTNNKSSINIKAKRISFSQESDISFVTKENNKFFSPVINKINIIILIFSQLLDIYLQNLILKGTNYQI